MNRKTCKLMVLLCAASLTGACATSRGVLELEPIVSKNPASGILVKIVEVEDLRKFELKPDNPSIPSLKNGEIADTSITSRAIARKRNGYGMALGDILLPQGETVTALVEAIVVRALRESGYRVLERGDPQYPNAAPLRIAVEKFWAWFSPGFWSANLDFSTKVSVMGPVSPFSDGQVFTGAVRLSTQYAGTGAWMNTVNKGLADLDSNIKMTLSAR